MHVDLPTRADLHTLLTIRRPGCVSLYLPTSPVPHDADAERIAFKNLAAEAVTQLEASDLDRSDVVAVDTALRELQDDTIFWRYQANSLAVFATPDDLRYFHLPSRLQAFVEVADRFFVKPLLRAVTFPNAGFVLALAQGSARVLEVAAELGPFEVELTDLPRAVSPTGGSPGDRGRMRGGDLQKTRMRQYARAVDRAVRTALRGHDLPVILAATEPLESIFRSVSTIPNLAAEGIAGNPEQVPDLDLAASARRVLDGIYAGEVAALNELFEQRTTQGRTATDLAEVARLATYGMVDTAIVDIDSVVPGTIDEETGALELASEDGPDSYGVVDEIARRVLGAGGRVVAVRAEDVPRGGEVAAILRYA